MKPEERKQPEIDRFFLKPDKWHEKLQGSRYWRNAQNSANPNDEYLEIDYENPIDRLTKITTLGASSRKHRNPIWGEKNNKSENIPKKSPT